MRTTLRLATRIVITLALATMGYAMVEPPTISGPCNLAWCKPGGTVAAAQALVDEQVAELTRSRDCWMPNTRQEIPATVIVRGATVHKSVAWTLPLDEAFATNRDEDTWNDVVVLRGCAAG